MVTAGTSMDMGPLRIKIVDGSIRAVQLKMLEVSVNLPRDGWKAGTKKYGRYPEESTCRLTRKVIRRSEECAC